MAEFVLVRNFTKRTGGESTRCKVYISVDEEGLADVLGARAFANKSRKSKLAVGVNVKVVEDLLTRPR